VVAVIGIAGSVWWLGSASTPSQEISAETLEAPTAEGHLFRINREFSEVRFTIHEELFGSPKTVIGVTNELAGDIIVNMENAANSQVGEIRVNARTLATDDENRNRSLRNLILESSKDEFEFISFQPTELSGLPEGPVAIGDTVTFQLTGDLTVRHITNSVTFDVTVTLDSEERLEGSATTMTTRAAYELTIPTAPGVANVTDEVTLEIDFVADLVESA
jgi:polyisoprenoid-binding protein YceI